MSLPPTYCARARESISAQLDGELPESEAGRLELHLLVCPDCAAWAEDVQGTTDWLREAPWEEDGTYIIPVYEERLVLTKQLVLREYLRVERVPTTERQQFADTVRRERLVVEDPDHTGRVHEEYVAPTSIPRTDSL